MKTDAIESMLKMSRPRGSTCWFSHLSSAELIDTVNEAMSHQAISSSTIARWLADQGVQVQQGAVQRHRRKDCKCERD